MTDDKDDDNGWTDYKRLILEQLNNLAASMKSLGEKVDRVEIAVNQIDKKVAVMEVQLQTAINDHARIERLEVDFAAQKVKLSIMMSLIGAGAGLLSGAVVSFILK